jgi:hypothetical protein
MTRSRHREEPGGEPHPAGRSTPPAGRSICAAIGIERDAAPPEGSEGDLRLFRKGSS